MAEFRSGYSLFTIHHSLFTSVGSAGVSPVTGRTESDVCVPFRSSAACGGANGRRRIRRWVVPRVDAPVPNKDGHYFFWTRAAFDVCES